MDDTSDNGITQSLFNLSINDDVDDDGDDGDMLEYLKQEELAANCEICSKSSQVSTMLQNANDHFYCKTCLNKIICLTKDFYDYDTEDDGTEPFGQRNKHMPNPGKYAIAESLPSSSSSSHHGLTTTTPLRISKEPILCPITECQQHVLLSNLRCHFKFQHNNIPLIPTALDNCWSTKFDLNDIKYCSTKCFAILKLLIKDEKDDGTDVKENDVMATTYPENPLIMVMATRIPSRSLILFGNETSQNDQAAGENNITAVRKQHNESNPVKIDDFMIFWLASSFNTNLKYTVAISNFNSQLRQKYYGPLLSLKGTAPELFKSGHCLTLTHLHCNVMSGQGKYPLGLSLAIHYPE